MLRGERLNGVGEAPDPLAGWSRVVAQRKVDVAEIVAVGQIEPNTRTSVTQCSSSGQHDPGDTLQHSLEQHFGLSPIDARHKRGDEQRLALDRGFVADLALVRHRIIGRADDALDVALSEQIIEKRPRWRAEIGHLWQANAVLDRKPTQSHLRSVGKPSRNPRRGLSPPPPLSLRPKHQRSPRVPS